MRAPKHLMIVLPVIATGLFFGCSKSPGTAPGASVQRFQPNPGPHGGTLVALGDDEYHIELVLDPAASKLQAYVFDDDVENFVRSTSTTIEITANAGDITHDIILGAVANPETGETIGDTSLFETRADWLRETSQFEGVIAAITVRGTLYSHVAFRFPTGSATPH
jgi:hypothetical protein